MLAEVAGALSRITGAPRVGHDLLQHLLRLPTLRLVPLDAPLGERAALVAAELGLRGADAIYVAVAERLGLPLITWDDDQRRRASRLISVRRPA
jgi:predicted nucleic acid-binding protein